MNSVRIADGVHWTGAVDWTVRNFHGHIYRTSRGTTYNAYLVSDEKTALIDTVARGFSDEMFRKIEEHTRLEKIDYIVMNHVEDDHSAALPELLSKCPGAAVIGTPKCREGLMKHYFTEMDFREVKTGDSVSLGNKTLKFIEAPMLHWPDSMFTYLEEDRILFPNDAFGQHYASSARFADESDRCVLMEEAKKYYANILWPLSRLVLRKIEELKKSGLEIDIIAPSHGLAWRKNPLEIIGLYADWAAGRTVEKAVIVYETMWGATERMARLIAEGASRAGIRVHLFDLNTADLTEVFGEMLDARGVAVGSSTHGSSMLPRAAAFLHLFGGMKPAGRFAAAFGSYGWGGGAVKEIEQSLEKAGLEVIPSVSVKYRPEPGEQEKCAEFGVQLAERIKKGG